jgi:alkanesulfonate monooxygenase SsuD/methylene tetrahydromethanopterin reductase-like flavin-dependent oxidoreductase (luciferase family)
MKFGIFDHFDSNGLPHPAFFESRLQLIETYDRLGFYAYHLAEHHSTPLGMAPSPSLILAAAAQRTTRLRFGPLVYALPFYHPLRIVEEICMLDVMSGGRLEIGFGRGASPIEMEFYGLDPNEAQALYAEALELVMQALTVKVLTFQGKTFKFTDVPMQLETLQKPHPPIWYGAHSPESAERAAGRGLNIVNNDSPDRAAATMARFRDVWREANGAAPTPMMGLVRFIVVAETKQKALDIARRAYPKWHASFTHLYRMRGRDPMLGERSRDFDSLRDLEGKGIAGDPKTVAAFLADQIRLTGANYLLGQFAFGDMSTAEVQTSVELFADHVAPHLRSDLLQTTA